MAVKSGLIRGAQLREQILKLGGARLDRPREANLFPRQIIKDCTATLDKFRVERSIFCNDGFRHFGKEWFVQSNLGTETSPTPYDHTRDIVASRVARDNTIRDKECC